MGRTGFKLLPAVVTVVLLGACGDDDGGGTPTPTPVETTTPDVEATAPDVETTTPDVETTTPDVVGDPIVLGVYAPTEAAQFSAPEFIAAARAAERYVNEDLGGVNGRPLQLEVCETRNTADTMLACANRLAQRNPVAVIGGPDFTASVALDQVFGPQGIPVAGGIGFIPTEFLGPDPVFRSIFVGSATALFPGLVNFAIEDLGAERMVAMSFESPTVQAVLDAFFNPVLAGAGLDPVISVTAPQGTADLTPMFQQAVSLEPDVIMVTSMPCIPVLRAYQATGTDIPLIQPDTCSTTSILDDAGDLAEGLYYSYQMRNPQLDPDDEEVSIYADAMERYADVPTNWETETAASAFAGIMNLRDLMLEMEGDITAESIQAAVRSTVDQPNFMGYGPYSCAEPPALFFPGICASTARIAQVQDGTLTYITEITETGVLLNP